MSRQKLRIKNTQLDNLVANLRGEVGEIITAWTIMHNLLAQERRLVSGDVAKDMKNENLAFFSILGNKLSDELVARLSELSESKIGRLSFYFASLKLGKLDGEVQAFRTFIQRHKFNDKRNYDISHKELPEEWSKHRYVHIPYKVVLRGIAHASSIMKKIDREVLGPSAKYLWHEMRKRRYSYMNPPKVAYMLLPYLELSNQIREKVIVEEMAEGREVWSDMLTTIDGRQCKIPVCKPWGAMLLDEEMIVLDQYPLQQLSEIKTNRIDPGTAAKRVRPVYEQKKITAKYRVANSSENKVSLVPVERQHRLDTGAATDLPDVTVNLNDELRENMGEMRVGDVKELSLRVTVLSGYELLPD